MLVQSANFVEITRKIRGKSAKNDETRAHQKMVYTELSRLTSTRVRVGYGLRLCVGHARESATRK